MKMLLGLHLLTSKESCEFLVDATRTWVDVQSNIINWDSIRRAMERPLTSPFIIRTDSEKHLVHTRIPGHDLIAVTYRTVVAEAQAELLRQAAYSERRKRFLEHFYTALDL